jgi:hypothetical protein
MPEGGIVARGPGGGAWVHWYPVLIALGILPSCGQDHAASRRPAQPPDAAWAQDSAAPAPSSDAAALPSDSGIRDAALRDAPASDAPAPEACPLRLSSEMMQHACLHAIVGPFAAVGASVQEPFADVSTPHTAFEINLPDESTGASVSFHPVRSAPHAFFLSEDLPFAIAGTDVGASLAAVHVQGTEACSAFERAYVHDLDVSERYRLDLGPGAGNVVLVIESLTDGDWEPDCGFDASPPVETGDARANDAGAAAPDASCNGQDASCPDACVDIHAPCTEDTECCSGRCYGQLCVALECQTDGYCDDDAQCCFYCHQTEDPHCH